MKSELGIKFHEISVRNYKNLENATLKIHDLAILVGPNNSGKSNFFDIVGLLKHLFYYGTEGKKRIARNFLQVPLTREEKAVPASMSISYSMLAGKKEQIMAVYKIDLEGGRDTIRILNESLHYKSATKTGPSKKLFERNDEILTLRVESDSGNESFRQHSVASDVSSLEMIRSIFPSSDNAPIDYGLLIPLFSLASAPVFRPHSLSRGYIRETAEVLPVLLDLKEKKSPIYKAFCECLSEILNLELIDFYKFPIPEMAKQASESRDHIICFVKERYKERLSDIDNMSDGTRILFLMLFHLLVSDEVIVFIDEPEIGLHPNAISKLLHILQRGEPQKQLVLSTHSSFLVNLVDPKYVTLSEPNKAGLSTFKPVSEIEDLQKRLKSKYVNFGDLFANNFSTKIDTSL